MIETDKPRAKGNMKCPLWKKPMKQVCHTCEWWVHLRGKHPQGEELIDSWGCAIAWLPCLTVENSQMQRQTAASVDKVATVMDQASTQSIAMRAELIGSMMRSVNSGPQPDRIVDASHYSSPR
jgi:hypothetical protein